MHLYFAGIRCFVLEEFDETFSSQSLQCVVIGLQSTGEARTMEQVDELNGELTDFISTAK